MLEHESGVIDAFDTPNETEVKEEVKEAEGQEAKEADETPEVTEEKENKTTGEEQVRKKRPTGFQRKISKLEQQNAELAARLAEIEKSKAPQGITKEPNLDDFDSFDAFNAALVQYKVDKALGEREKKVQEQQEQQKVINEQQAANLAWEKKVESLGELAEEYEELVAEHSTTLFREELIQATYESDLGPQIRHYLLKNPEELAKVNKPRNELSSLAIYKKIADLEDQLSAKPAVKVSKSSDPITPLKGSVKTAVKLESLDTDAFLQQRHPHLFKRK